VKIPKSLDIILARQFRPLVYYFHIPGIAEDPVALCARQLYLFSRGFLIFCLHTSNRDEMIRTELIKTDKSFFCVKVTRFGFIATDTL